MADTSASAQSGGLCGPARSSRATLSRATSSASRPARSTSPPRQVAVGERYRRIALAMVSHGHPQQQAVEPGPPGAGLEAAKPPGAAVSGRPGPSARRWRPASARSVTGRRRRGRTAGAPAPGTPSRGPGTRSPGSPASSSRWAATAEQGLVWRSERSASRARSSGAPASVGGAEGGADQRSEQLDVGAHDDDVAGLEGRVGRQQVEHGVARPLRPGGPGRGRNGSRRLSSSRASRGRGSSCAGQRRPGGDRSARMSAWMRPSRRGRVVASPAR